MRGTMHNLNNELQRVYTENERLKSENNQLRQILRQHGIKIPPAPEHKNQQFNLQKAELLRERVNIYKSLFKGREDVFAYRWEMDNGETGYSPARKFAPSNQHFIPLTDQQIYDHLSGKKTIGLYPLLKDNTCWLLAVDFDKKEWHKDVTAFCHTCDELNIPVSIERSRSGNGAHVWIFFTEPIPAKLVRMLGKILLNKTSEKFGHAKMDSYDRLFPNQDSMPVGGFGNLIALLLQGESRKNNNSVFINENFNPYPNQWSYLSKVKKMNNFKSNPW